MPTGALDVHEVRVGALHQPLLLVLALLLLGRRVQQVLGELRGHGGDGARGQSWGHGDRSLSLLSPPVPSRRRRHLGPPPLVILARRAPRAPGPAAPPAPSPSPPAPLWPRRALSRVFPGRRGPRRAGPHSRAWRRRREGPERDGLSPAAPFPLRGGLRAGSGAGPAVEGGNAGRHVGKVSHFTIFFGIVVKTSPSFRRFGEGASYCCRLGRSFELLEVGKVPHPRYLFYFPHFDKVPMLPPFWGRAAPAILGGSFKPSRDGGAILGVSHRARDVMLSVM